MNRFKMNFDNSGVIQSLNYNNLASNMSRVPVPIVRPNSVALNAPMINRVHRAKPGCSACGKKVA
jgi:hypothetical protein